MPFVSPAAIQRIQSTVNTKDKAIATLKSKVARASKSDPVSKLMDTAEIGGGAAIVGALRGKFEDPNGAWNIPGTSIDIELALSMLGLGMSHAGLFPKALDGHVTNVANGAFAHYAGQVARNSVKEGAFTMVAGGSELDNALAGF